MARVRVRVRVRFMVRAGAKARSSVNVKHGLGLELGTRMAMPIISSDVCKGPDGELSHLHFIEEEVRHPSDRRVSQCRPGLDDYTLCRV